MPNPKLEPVVLSAEERQVLERRARRRTTSLALALAFADRAGLRGRRVGHRSGRRPEGVAGHGAQVAVPLPGLVAGGFVDEPRPGAPRTITDERSSW